MFKNMISETPLTNEAANQFFDERIFGDAWNGDTTFVATLRALLNPRMGDDDKLRLDISSSRYSEEQLNNLADKKSGVMAIADRWLEDSDNIRIHYFRGQDENSNAAWLKLMEESYVKGCGADWHRIDKVTAFFRKVMNVLCFIRPSTRSVVVFTDNIDYRRFHYLQCGILAFLPWYFNPGDGVSDIEMELINSLREKTSDKYETCIAKIAEQYNFEEARIRKLLSGFETKYEEAQLQRMNELIADIMHSLERLDEQYANYLRNMRDYQNTAAGLQLKIGQSSGESEIMDYFLFNKCLDLESVSGSRMTFVVRSKLDFFNEELAKKMIDYERSDMYRYRGQLTRNEMRRLMEEIFIKQNLAIRFCTAYQFEIGGRVRALEGYNYGPKCRGYIPNPHIDGYSCMGTYQSLVNERLKENDYIGAIEQCITSAKSLNFADSTVMNRFYSKIYTDDVHRFIETPDGKVLTVKEAVDWINNNHDAEEEA